jgi:hypothetical protein
MIHHRKAEMTPIKRYLRYIDPTKDNYSGYTKDFYRYI